MIVRFVYLLAVNFLILGCEPASGSKMLAAFPKIIRPGSPLIVNCNLMKGGSESVQLILAKDGINVIQNSSVVVNGKQNQIMLNVPSDLAPSKNFMVKLIHSKGSIWSPIQYDSMTSLVLIQTDRAMYAKNEEVKMRIVMLQPTLKPFKGQFKVEIYDGKNKLVQQWLKVQRILGVFSKKFSIPSDPNTGQWRIVVENKERKSEKTFIVRKYVIPKYIVTMSCPQIYTASTRTLRCTVKARYTFGRPVKGVVQIQFVTKTREGDKFLCDDHADISGEFAKVATLRTGINYENDIEVLARVSDPSTGTTVVQSKVVKLKRDEKVKWSLEPKRKNFQSGLPFVTFIAFQNPNTARAKVSIDITERKVKTCNNAYTYQILSKKLKSETVNVNRQGIGKISLNLDSAATELKIMTHSGAEKNEETLHVAKSNDGLVILPQQAVSVVGTKSTFKIVTKTAVTAPLWYTISARGTELSGGKCGHGTKSSFTCPIKIEPLYYPNFQLLFYYVTPSGVVSEDSVFISVAGNPTNNFVSISKDKKNSYTPGEEVKFIVKSSKQSVVFMMAVDEGIQKSQPGFDISMSDIISALKGEDSPSTDSYHSVNLLGINRKLKADISHYPAICRDPCASSPCRNGGKCLIKSAYEYKCKCTIPFTGKNCQDDPRIKKINSISGIVLSQSLLLPSFDIGQPAQNNIVFGLNRGQSPQRHRGPSPQRHRGPPPKSVPKPSQIPIKIANADTRRFNFPRTWIWEDVHISKASSVSFKKKLPDSMTTWITTAFCVNDDDGFGILKEDKDLKIQVSLPFFVELKTPSNVVAGSSAAVKISLFNNDQYTKMVWVYIEFQSKIDGFLRQLGGGNSTLHFHGIKTKADKYGKFNITVVAYDFFAGYRILDWVQIPINVKAPGIEQEYSIPQIVSMSSQSPHATDNIQITLPQHALKGTKTLYVTVTGDILAPSINGLGHLIRSPCGCGEQTMMYLAPNIYVIQYLKNTKQLSAEMKWKTITNINRGIDNQMRWRRSDGSFSVWGNSDAHGSTWLTSFVLMCFHQADDFVPVDRNIFKSGISWLLKKQNSDGYFREDGRVIHYQMQGGVRASRVTFTAYALLTLLETSDFAEYRTKIATAKKKAVQFLTRSSNIHTLQRSSHGMALTSYVLQKAGYHEKARQIYFMLKRKSKSTGQYMFWQDNSNVVYQQKLSWQSPNPRARPIDIETSAYALLYLTEKRDATQGMKILNWLVSQRNPQGGFSSTQDTVSCLHALSRFAIMLQQSTLQAEVKVKAGSTENTFHVHTRNRRLVQRLELDKSTSNVEIKAKGNGLVLVDVVVKYNVMKSEDSAFTITTTIKPSQQTFDKITVRVCIRRKDNKDNGMVLAEVGVPSGFVGDLTKTSARGLEHKETSSDGVVLYFKNLHGSAVCFDVTSGRVDKVTESQAIPILVYDYYEPENYGISSYVTGKLEEMSLCKICKNCNICQGTYLG